MKNNLYIVTGGAGFIGSHLVETLINKGFNVLVIDDLSTGYKKNLPSSNRIIFLNKKVQDVSLRSFSKIKGIFHLAAQASVPYSLDKFYQSSKNNLLSSIKIFSWAKNYNVPVVYASSSAIYGDLPIGNDSDGAIDILSPYAQDKLTLENYANMMFKVFGINSIGLRLFNVFGPRQDATNPYSGVISIFIDRILNKKTVTINGGYQTRDFIVVDNVIDVIVRSMELLMKKSICDVINVGTGKSTSIDDLFDCLTSILGFKPKIINKDLPPGDPVKSSGKYEKLKKVLSININDFYNLKDGLHKTIKFING